MNELNLDPLEKALNQLQEGLHQAQIRPDDEVVRDGVIQRFEYSMDLSWKILQRYLKTIVQIEESNILSKKDIFREAARSKLIDDAEVWIGHYNARNKTSHIYNAEIAQSVFERAKVFLSDAKTLLELLRHGA